MAAQIPIYSKNIGRLPGKQGWERNLDLAAFSAAKMESAFGPKGSYKMVSYNRGPERVVKVTRDPVEVLAELEVQFPGVKTLAEAARIHREHVGDGVTTMVIIVSGLLKEGRRLAKRGIHPTTVLQGYHAAAKEAIATVDEAAYQPSSDPVRRLLGMVDCGRGVLTGPLLQILLEAASRANEGGPDELKQIKVLKESGGSLVDSTLVRGLVLKKAKAHPSMPEGLGSVRVALISRKLDLRPVESLMRGKGPFNMKVDPRGNLERFRREELRLRKEIAATIAASGARLAICRSKVAREVADDLSQRGILALELVDEKDMEAAAAATGGFVIGDWNDIRQSDLGEASRVETRKLDGIDHVVIEAPRGSTIVLRASSDENLRESERVLKSAITVLRRAKKDGKLIPGGGAMSMQIAERLRGYALEFPSREQLAIEAFAAVMERIPLNLARNYGLHQAMAVAELRRLHATGASMMGISEKGCVRMDAVGVEELASNLKDTLRRAVEVTALLMRIDDCYYVKQLPLVHKK